MVLSQLLNQEFSSRQSRNKRYSIRSFAKWLNMDATGLLRIMKGDRVPTLSTTTKVLSRLGFTIDEQKKFLAKIDNAKLAKAKLLSNPFDEAHFENTFTKDHVLVLTALRLKKYSLATLKEKMCAFLDLSSRDLEKIMKDLQQIGAIQIEGGKVRIIYKNKSTVPLPLTTKKRREIQQEFLSMAIKSIESVPFEKRDNATLTVPLELKDLDSVKKILQDARIKINALSEKQKTHNSIYNISTAFYPVIQ